MADGGEAVADPARSLARLRAEALARPGDVLAQVRVIVAADPDNAEAHRIGALALRALGRTDHAIEAERAAIGAAARDPLLIEVEQALKEKRRDIAERLLRARVAAIPQDVVAQHRLGALCLDTGRFDEAEARLRRAVALAPAHVPARAALARLLFEQSRDVETLAELDRIVALDPASRTDAMLRPATLGRLGEFDRVIAFYEATLARNPRQPRVWLSYGHMLKTVGRQPDAMTAYRKAIALRPDYGEAWWSIANLKTVAFSDADVAAMSAALGQEALSDTDRLHIHFALGKAREARCEWAASFADYAAGNAIRRRQQPFRIEDVRAFVERSCEVMTTDFFAARAGGGHDAPDPIFILGMPRAGSTLIEQILASHPLVEGTQELADIPLMLRKLVGSAARFPAVMAGLDADARRALGQDYLARTRIQRKTDRPYFIDKQPNNWMHAGFIRLILPNAKIIDARRHPLASCLSNFKQHFATGQAFAYDLADLGAYYRHYVRLMAHLDAVQPGAVHRVFYEEMVADSDAQIRMLLDAMGLPFDPACLRFWETKRAVRTASSEQVRRPINRDGLDAWQPYAPWLGPLEAALGDVLTRYPAVPEGLA